MSMRGYILPDKRRNREIVEEAIRDALSDWDGDFEFSVTVYDDEDCSLLEAEVTHAGLNQIHHFFCGVNGSGYAQMDFSEDCWYDLNKENLFVYMWFDLAIRLKYGGAA